MHTDDRFTAIAVTGALLVTIAVFFLSHPGLVAVAPEIVSIDETASTSTFTSKAPKIEVQPISDFEHEIVLATLGGEAETFVLAANEIVDPAAQYAEFIDELSDLGQGVSDLPGLQDVLVRTNRDGRTVVASGTNRQYQDFVMAIDDLEVEEIASILNESAEIARAGFVTALDQLLAAPVADEDPDMESKGWYWGFADEDYETLTLAQKHMLLMGRDNAKIVRSKLETLRETFAEPAGAPLPSPTLPPTSPMLTQIADAQTMTDQEGTPVTP